jgi:DNA-binding transcriptional LysR family regulator
MLAWQQVQGLHAGQIDVGLVRPPVRDEYVIIERMRMDDLVVALPTGHRCANARDVDLAELRHDRFVAYPSDPVTSTLEATVTACHDAGFDPQIDLAVSETASLVTLVAAGLGVALVPGSVQHLRVAGIEYKPLKSPSPQVELSVATRANETAPTVARCVEVLRELLGAPTG